MANMFDTLINKFAKKILSEDFNEHNSSVASTMFTSAAEVEKARTPVIYSGGNSATSPFSSESSSISVINSAVTNKKDYTNTDIDPKMLKEAKVIDFATLAAMEITTQYWSSYQILPSGGYRPTSNIKKSLINPNVLDQQGKFMRMLDSLEKCKVDPAKFDGYIIKISGNNILLERSFNGKTYLNIVSFTTAKRSSMYIPARPTNHTTSKQDVSNPVVERVPLHERQHEEDEEPAGMIDGF